MFGRGDAAPEPCDNYTGNLCGGFGETHFGCWSCGWDRFDHKSRLTAQLEAARLKSSREGDARSRNGDKLMATGTMVFEMVDDFPTTTRPGSGNKGPRETDVDIALKQYKDAGAQGVLKLLDYNEAPVLDEQGNPTVDVNGTPVTEKVDEATARSRASGRVAPLKSRGYAIEDGWVVVARNGAVYAKFYGAGNVPAEFIRKTKPVGEDITV